jgi:hypothetical protein
MQKARTYASQLTISGASLCAAAQDSIGGAQHSLRSAVGSLTHAPAAGPGALRHVHKLAQAEFDYAARCTAWRSEPMCACLSAPTSARLQRGGRAVLRGARRARGAGRAPDRLALRVCTAAAAAASLNGARVVRCKGDVFGTFPATYVIMLEEDSVLPSGGPCACAPRPPGVLTQRAACSVCGQVPRAASQLHVLHAAGRGPDHPAQARRPARTRSSPLLALRLLAC